jgi:hypothetical protein
MLLRGRLFFGTVVTGPRRAVPQGGYCLPGSAIRCAVGSAR